MKKYILVAIAVAVVAPLLAIGGARTGTSVDMKCDTMTISADSLLKETPLFDRLYLDAVCRQIAGDSTASALLERCHEMRPDAAEVYYSLAHSYLKQGNDSLARVNMRRAAELQPDNDNYLENVAETYIDQREYDRAIEAYEQLYTHHRDRSDVLELLVRLYNAKKDYHKMLSTIDRMEQADGPSEETSLMRMGIYEQQGDKKNAYRILHALTNDHPNEPSYKVMLGNWLMQHDRKSEAYNWFKSALEDDKQNEFALNSLYDYYRSMGDDTKARQLRDNILFSPQTDIKTKLSMLQQAIRENEQEQGGDSTAVLALFDKIMLATPRNAELSNLKAMYMRVKKMPQDSINAAYAHTLSFEPDNLSARLTLAQNKWEEKKWDEVVDLCDKGIQYTPEELTYYYFMALAYIQQDEDQKAYEACKRGLNEIDLNKADEPERNMASDMYGIIGDISYTANNHDEAFSAYEKAITIYPDNIQVLNNYAYYLSQQNTQLDHAAEMSLRTLKEEPTNATYLDTYAWILFLQKRYDEAKAYVDLTLQNSKNPDKVLLEHAGDIYLMAGDKEKAVSYWKQAIEAGGNKASLERKIKTRKLK
ncbi:tetratricopeptide repeat protein [Leyella stercorea]|uniref:tetratricopeptide repeat protein n=1 Tax=Leyella stercorea TaxID=363265 RepID=UPI00242F3230|nr:tetratricopeptide repeat protein [Leyella stercorea]